MNKLIVLWGVYCSFSLLAASKYDSYGGYTWYYTVNSGKATIEDGTSRAISPPPSGELVFPTSLDGYPVDAIGKYAFNGCSDLTGITLPEGLTKVGEYSFRGCKKLERIDFPSSLKTIGQQAFAECANLRSVVIPEGVVDVGKLAFWRCESLESITYPSTLVVHGGTYAGDPVSSTLVFPDGFKHTGDTRILFDVSHCSNLRTLVLPSSFCSYGDTAFIGCTNLNKLVCYFDPFDVTEGGYNNVSHIGLSVLFFYPDEIWFDRSVSNSWGRVLRNYGYGGRKVCFEGAWPDVRVLSDSSVQGKSGQDHYNITISNVVISCVVNSVSPQFAKPASQDIGFVNIITEVKGGCIAVPATWSSYYPKFTEKFGSDFTKALAMKTGKKDGVGNPMFVWQDYVAGTDPTKEDDVFTASITIVDGEVKVSYTPELDDARKALRKYTTWGKKSLLDTGWTEVAPGKETDYSFFKVTVEMK